ncbi:MAG: NADH-quinone oxidoreductase subunit NuoK [Actinobacteria bacterium]|nr:NADH-quinone oxidoreductase subunit NuoK [Actinomycetota bacterium]MCL4555261.1 NADH-quinone oxidoreductase subunit NuoK [Actinomycetota bacterium]MCL5888079.1 NADH-quinone oxidoreductase subunit NuoK [Actinomycetota bacterium]
MNIGLEAFLGLSAVLFALGLYGALSKRSAVMVLMSLELMAVAVGLNLVAFSRFVTPEAMTGQAFAIFAMVVSAAEIGLALAIVIAIYRHARSVELSALERLKG